MAASPKTERSLAGAALARIQRALTHLTLHVINSLCLQPSLGARTRTSSRVRQLIHVPDRGDSGGEQRNHAHRRPEQDEHQADAAPRTRTDQGADGPPQCTLRAQSGLEDEIRERPGEQIPRGRHEMEDQVLNRETATLQIRRYLRLPERRVGRIDHRHHQKENEAGHRDQRERGPHPMQRQRDSADRRKYEDAVAALLRATERRQRETTEEQADPTDGVLNAEHRGCRKGEQEWRDEHACHGEDEKIGGVDHEQPDEARAFSHIAPTCNRFGQCAEVRPARHTDERRDGGKCKRGQSGDERQRVHTQNRRKAHRADHHSGEQRCDDRGHGVAGLNQRVGAREPLGRHQLRDTRGKCGRAKRVEQSGGSRADVHVPHLKMTRHQQARERERDECAQQVTQHHDVAAVMPVHDCARERRDGDGRQGRCQERQRELRGRACRAQDPQAERKARQARAHCRDQQADPDDREVSGVAQPAHRASAWLIASPSTRTFGGFIMDSCVPGTDRTRSCAGSM